MLHPSIFTILLAFTPGPTHVEAVDMACTCVCWPTNEADELHPPPPLDELADLTPAPYEGEPTDDNPCPPSD
jgi:hypothetical protein